MRLRTYLFALVLPALPACGLDFGQGVSDSPGGGDGAITSALVDLAVPSGAAAARLVDVDGDGARDLVYLAGGRIVVEHGSGTGAFGPAMYGPLADARLLAFGDVDADGIVDIVSAGDTRIDVWHCDGHGALTPLTSLATLHPVLAIEVANAFGTAGDEVGFVLSNGYTLVRYDGSNVMKKVYTLTIGHSVGLALGSVSTFGPPDGALDLVLAANDGQGGVIVDHAAQQGSTFTFQAVDVTTGSVDPTVPMTSVAIGDIDGNGEADVVVGQAGGVSAYPGYGYPMYSPAEALPDVDFVATGAGGDIFAVSADPAWLSVLRVTAANELGVARTLILPATPTALHADGDANGDGVVDPVITTTAGVTILMSSVP